MAYINIDVDLDEILWSLSNKEKQQLVNDLYNDGYIPKKLYKKLKNTNPDFDEACEKMMGKSWHLTKEEEEFIINLSKRFV